MGQTKKLLEEIETIILPDDLDFDYESWLAQKEAEKLAYEEMLADSK